MRGPSGKRFGAVLAGLTALALFASTVSATAASRSARLRPAPDKDAAIIVDGTTGNVLYARNADAIRYPASLTKMMTLYLLFEEIEKGKMSMDTQLSVSAHAASQSPTKLGLQPGGSISVETAINAMAILSANDVAVVVAEALGGGSESRFASLMTAKAHELGMSRTNFHNASGLPDSEQRTTARDMALLGRHLAYDFPQYYGVFSAPSFTYAGRVYRSHDNLLKMLGGTDGIKTGYTRASGFNLVTSAVRDGKHLVGVVMGGTTAASRDQEMVRILSTAFDFAERDPGLIAKASVPWLGGSRPPDSMFKMHSDPENVLAAVLDPPSKNATVVARAGAPVNPPVPTPKSDVIQVAALNPPLQTIATVGTVPVPESKPAAVQVASIEPSGSESDSSGQIEEGDIGDASVAQPAPRPDADASRRWAVQIGAFTDEAVAEAQLSSSAKRVLEALGQAEHFVVPFSAVNGNTLYRARFGLFTEDEARDICKRMTERGQTCFAAQSQ